MRDPARIPEVLARLQAVWQREPDTRLGQLIYNAMRISNVDLFSIEDEQLLHRLEYDMRRERRLEGAPGGE